MLINKRFVFYHNIKKRRKSLSRFVDNSDLKVYALHYANGHVLKPETTKRNGRNETTETKPPKRAKPPKRPKRAKPPKRPKRAKINGKVKKITALISVTLLWQPDLAPLKSMHVCDIVTSQLAGPVRSCKDD